MTNLKSGQQKISDAGTDKDDVGRHGASVPAPFLSTDGVLFMRPLTLEDSGLIVDWRNNPRVRAHYIYKKDFTLEGQRRYYRERVETGQVVQMIFCVRTDEGEKEPRFCPIGCAVLDDIHPQYAECGNWIGEDRAVGHGYSPRMIRMICDYGFRTCGLEDIVARIFVDNPASIRSYERAGFQTAGILPEVESTDGTRQDMLFLRLTRKQFHGTDKLS